MDQTIILIGVFAVFIPALILPGPDFVAVVRASLTRGPRAGLLTTAGVTLGLCFYASLSLLGLSAVLSEYQWLTWLVRALGGSYLIYLGIKLILARPAPLEIDQDEPAPTERVLLFGFLVTLTNPKAIVLFASVFATAVTPETPTTLLVLMVGLAGGAAFVWYSLVTLFMTSPPVIAVFVNAKHRIEQIAGGCFIAIGGKILFDAKNPVNP